MRIINRLYRRCCRKLLLLSSKLRRQHFRLLGQIDIHSSAKIDSGVNIAVDWRNKQECTVSIGAGTVIKSGAYLGPRNGFIKIGNHCSINPYCVLLGYGGITIEDGVRIAAHTAIIAFNHNYEDPEVLIAKQGNRMSGVTIESDVWIGAGARILDGVHIGKGAVVGAGSVVTRDVPPLSVVAGVPAKIIKSRQSSK